MKVKTIPSSWIMHEGRRLDCGPYMSGALDAKILLERLSVRKDRLRDVTEGGMDGIVNAGRIRRIWVDNPTYGVLFLSSSDILQADLSMLPLISKRVITENPQLLIKQGWTLITRSGTIGRMTYARPDMDGMACSEHVMRVLPDRVKIPSGYLYVYLSSKFGLPQVISGTYGSIIQSIEPHHIANLPVPRLEDAVEQRAHKLMEDAAQLLTLYQHNIMKATDIFFASVGLRDITSSEWHAEGSDLGFSQIFPCIDSLRAVNFNPRYKRLCERIKAGPWRPLGEICVPNTLKRGGRYKRIDAAPEYAYQLVGQKQLFWLKPEGRWIAKSTVGDDVLVEPGTILVAAQGTLGESELYCRAEFAWGPGVNLAYSEHILRVLADERIMPRGCLYAFMRSEIAFRMFRSISVGTKLQDHHHVFRSQLPIPFPPKEVQLEVNQLIIDAYNARHRAIGFENEATHLVEQAIEEAA